MDLGYVPDPFGHIGQLPQLLRGFGIDSAVFSRGMGDEGESLGAEFRWLSPDGSEVLGLWLAAHYGNFVAVGSFNPWASDARFDGQNTRGLPLDGAVRSTRELIQGLAARSTAGVLLLDAGSDHLAPRADLPATLKALEAALNEDGGAGTVRGVRFFQGGFEDYAARVRERLGRELRSHEGELRGSRYQNMLYGVLSARMPLKQFNREVDDWLTHYAEPLACAAWLFGGREYPRSLLGLAWRLYLQNQAHDSICGCSTDVVTAEMISRYTQAREVAAAVAAESLAAVSRSIGLAGPRGEAESLPVLVFNPTPRPANVIVTAHVPRDWAGAAEGARYIVAGGSEDGVSAQVLDGPWRNTQDGTGVGSFAPSAVLAAETRRGEPSLAIAFPARDLPALGCRVYFIARAGAPMSEAPAGAVKAGDGTLENEFLAVTVAPCGAIDLLDKRTGHLYRGLNVFEDSGDTGDEYDFCPAGGEPVLTAACAARVFTEERGPYVGTLRVEIPWQVPAALGSDRRRRREERAALGITTRVTLTGNAPYAAIQTRLENTARDHRLRVLFPTGTCVDHVFAEGGFDVVRRKARPREAAYWFQPEAAQLPQQGFVDASDGATGLAVIARGLPEYECLKAADGELTLAVTLLRCVEWLSREDLTTRRGHAGPAIFTPGAQCPGTHVFEYAVAPHAGTWLEAGLPIISGSYASPPLACVSSGQADQGQAGRQAGLLELAAGSPAVAVTAVKKAEDGEGLVVRMLNTAGDFRTARLEAGFEIARAFLAALDETPGEALAITGGRAVEVPVGPKKIVTVLLFKR